MAGLCQKGWTAGALLGAPERLTTPPLREGDRLRPASWQEALGRIADGITEIQREHGPDAMAVFGGLRLGDPAAQVDRAARTVTTEAGFRQD